MNSQALPSQEEVIGLVNEYAHGTFFVRYPELRGQSSVVIVSSIAEGFFDEYSDIDVKFVFPEPVLHHHRENFMEFEKRIAARQEFVQFILRDSYEGLEEQARNWENDNMIREFSSALIVHDPHGRFAAIQKELAWYPPYIMQEKINYLFSHIVFQIDHFYRVSVKRNDRFFNLVIKGRILEAFMAITFFLNKRYVNGKKIYLLFSVLPYIPPGLKQVVDELLSEPNREKGIELAKKGRQIVEAELVKRQLIPSREDEYWLKFRAKHMIDFPLIPL